MEKLQNVTSELQKLVKQVTKDGGSTDSTEELMDKMLELMGRLPKLDVAKEHKKLLPQLDQCAVMLWNAAVAKKTGGHLTPLLNARLRHTACNLVYLCSSHTNHEVTLKKQTMMALKTARAWLDANDPTMAENPLSMASDCIEKQVELLHQTYLGGGGDAESLSEVNKRQELDKDRFKLLCYKAEALCGQDKHEEGFNLILQAKEMLHKLPTEGGYMSMLCYNFGVDSFQKGQHGSCVKWLRESFELGKGKAAVGAKNQARTLRLLAHAYLEWDSKVHWQKALNAVGLANAEFPHPAGLYLKVRILLEGSEGDDRLKNGLDDVLRHPDLSVDLGLNTIKLIVQHQRTDVAFEGLKQLTQRFENTPYAGQVSVSHLEMLIQAKQVQDAKNLVEKLITGDHTGQPLDVSSKKRIHLIVWEQAALASESNKHETALQWYNYSLSLYKTQEDNDTNLSKLHRNRASCLIELDRMNEAEEALSKAESCDSLSPFTFYIKYKLALLKGQEETAISALQKMCECVREIENMDGPISGIIKDQQKLDVIHGLICLAAQLAFERNNRSVALHALESLVSHSPDHQQVLTALRCLVRLRLTLQEETLANANRQELLTIKGYIKAAYEKLVHSSGLENTPVNVQNEATWFMKIAWNMGLKSEECYREMEEFFLLCSKLQLLCPVDLAALNRHKTCLLMASAASLQLAKGTSDQLNKREILKQTLQHVEDCRDVLRRIDQVKLTESDSVNSDSTTPVLLILYEFEAKARRKDPDIEQILENALTLPHCEAKAFETIAALSMEAPGEHRSLSTRALKIAIKKHLQADKVNYTNCSKAFHSLINLALQSGSHSDPGSREEAWAYYVDVVNLIENKAQGEYPEIEILWLMTKAWNCGIHLFSATKYSDCLQWCELAMKLLKYLGPLKVNYEKQMNTVYSEILAKVDSMKTHSTMEQ